MSLGAEKGLRGLQARLRPEEQSLQTVLPQPVIPGLPQLSLVIHPILAEGLY